MTPPGPVPPDSGDELAVVQIVNEGAPIVTITPDGQVILADGTSLDEAARLFWDAIAEHAAQMTEQARADVDRLRAQNKASSDAWTKRTAAMQSRIDGFDNTRRWIKSHPDWENQWLCSSFVQKIFILAFIEERLGEVRAEERARIADAYEALTRDFPVAEAWCARHHLGLTAGVGQVLASVAHDIRHDRIARGETP